ncbi:MAG: dUTP diphosphatase [Phycisphaerales bacterium]|nr:dUTP diphosphatase [Phycisphaerales bacterium]
MKQRETLKIRRRDGIDDIPLPEYKSEHAAGLDLCAAVDEPVIIAPGDIKLIPTGLYVEIPQGCEGQIRARSGLALKHGLMLPNSPGTIDADYRGELQVIVGNVGREPFTITRGMRFAQLIIARYEPVRVELVDELSNTQRGAGGFGHTGR